MIHKSRVVIVGCGKISGFFEDKLARRPYSHGSAFYKNPSFIISGCVDSDGHKAKIFSEKYSIEAYGDNLETIIHQVEPHVIAVCTPNVTHFDVVKKILAQKRKDLQLIFLEKPVCSTFEELDRLVSLSEVSGIPMLVNMSRRYHPWYRYLKSLYAENKIGNLIRGDISYSGGWKHNGVHAVDTIEFLFPGEYCKGEIWEHWKGRHANDPTYTVRMELAKNGAPIWFHGFDEKHYQVFDCEFKFEAGRLRITNFEEEIRWEQASINSLGERILISGDLQFPAIRNTCIEEAVGLIQNFLRSREQNQLEGYRVEDIVTTMRAIWTIEEKIDSDGSQ